MKSAWKIIKRMGIYLLGAVEFIVLYLVIGLFVSYVAVNRTAKDESDVSIYLLSNGMHTDIVVPIKNEQMDWSTLIKFEDTKGKDSTASYLAFGWGDKGFYMNTPTWGELKFSTAFKAAFWLSEPAMHTTFHKTMTTGSNCVRINISKENYQRLIDYITSSFQADEMGNPLLITTDAQYGSNDAFYESKGKYSLFYTCNSWANNGLKASQQKASFWALLDGGMFFHYQDAA